MVRLSGHVTQRNDWSPLRHWKLELELWLTPGHASVVYKELAPGIFLHVM